MKSIFSFLDPQENQKVKSYFFVALACILVLVLAPGPEASYITAQITDNAGTDRDPQIDGAQVVWSGDSEGNFEIYLYDVIGAGTNKISQNPLDDINPTVHAGQVAWQGYDGEDHEIFLYDGAAVTQLTENQDDDLYPQIDSGQVVWQHFDGSDFEIFAYDGVEVRQLTNNIRADLNPTIYAGQIVWQQCDGADCKRGDGDWEVFHHDLVTGMYVRITSNDGDDRHPDIDEGIVAYQGYDGNDYEIYVWDGSETTPITDNEVMDMQPRIDGDMIVWSQQISETIYDIYSYEISTGETELVGYNGAHNWSQQIDKGRVTWLSQEGLDREVYLDQVGKLSQGSLYNEGPQISDFRVVWFGYVESDMEIFLSLPGLPFGDVAPRGDLDGHLLSADQAVGVEIIRAPLAPELMEFNALDIAPFELCEGAVTPVIIHPTPDGTLTVEDLATLIQIQQGYVVPVGACP